MTELHAQDNSSGAAGEVPAAMSLPSPGTLLRAAREKAGLSAEDLGGQLKLAKGTLEALERDDFAALSEPVYVRGYYRKIAKLLPVPEKDLIAAYNARSKPARNALPATPSRIPLAGGVAAGASRHSFGPGVGVLVLAAIAVVVVLVMVMDRVPTRRIAEPAPAAVAATESMSPAVTPEPGPDSVATPAPAAPAPAASPQPAPAPAVKTVPAAAAAPAKSAAPEAAVANQLVLNFSESSFVRVEDSRGKTLAIGLVRADERQALDGMPPYTVFLGNAKNVKVFFNGQPVDFSAHVNAQNDTARFMVP